MTGFVSFGNAGVLGGKDECLCRVYDDCCFLWVVDFFKSSGVWTVSLPIDHGNPSCGRGE